MDWLQKKQTSGVPLPTFILIDCEENCLIYSVRICSYILFVKQLAEKSEVLYVNTLCVGPSAFTFYFYYLMHRFFRHLAHVNFRPFPFFRKKMGQMGQGDEVRSKGSPLKAY